MLQILLSKYLLNFLLGCNQNYSIKLTFSAENQIVLIQQRDQ